MNYKQRMKATEIEIENAYPERAKSLRRIVEPTLIDAEFWDNKDETLFNGAQFKLMLGKLPMYKWISDNGLEICKKYEATSILIVGEKHPENNCWIIKKCRNIWLRPIKN